MIVNERDKIERERTGETKRDRQKLPKERYRVREKASEKWSDRQTETTREKKTKRDNSGA